MTAETMGARRKVVEGFYSGTISQTSPSLIDPAWRGELKYA